MNNDPRLIAGSLIEGLAADLIEKDPTVAAAMAQTNAAWWSLDTYQIESAGSPAWGSLEFQTTISLCGERSAEFAAQGHALNVAVRASARQRWGRWTVRSYEVVSCSRNFDVAAAA